MTSTKEKEKRRNKGRVENNKTRTRLINERTGTKVRKGNDMILRRQITKKEGKRKE